MSNDNEQDLTPAEVADFARWKAERDEAELAEDLRVTRPFRIYQTLNGDPSFTLREAYDDFIILLRSGDPLPQPLRDAIADALVRGQTDTKQGVRLKIEADQAFFKAIHTFAAREKLLDAGLYIARERYKGRRPGEIRQDLPSMFEIVDAEDYEKRAKRIYKEFQSWLEANYSNEGVFDWRPTNDVHSYERIPDLSESGEADDPEAPSPAAIEDDAFFPEEEDDYFAQARFLFLKATSPANIADAYAAVANMGFDVADALLNRREERPG